MATLDEITYRPKLNLLNGLGTLPGRLLVLGTPSADLLDAARAANTEVRLTAPAAWGEVLHTGMYEFRVDGEPVALLVLHGKPGVPPVTERQRFATGHLSFPDSIFRSMWAAARGVATDAGLEVGDHVRIRATRAMATVSSLKPRLGSFEVTVDGPAGRQTFDLDAVERIEGDPRDPEFWITQPGGRAEDVALTVTWTKLRHPLTDTIYSFASSKTIFRPYQFAPVLKLLNSASGRLLIADEVGLGKTIEAGLIWSELEQRSQLERVLIVAPASLSLKWKSEMARRFDREVTILKPRDLLEVAADMREGRERSFAGVISLEALRAANDALEALSEVHARFDLVIVDEAHALRNKGRRGYEMGQLLSDWADVLVFLSATPLNLGQHDLFNLVNMLSEDEFSDPDIFETQLEPNQVLNQVAKQLAVPGAQPRKLREQLESISSMELGASVTARPDYRRLMEILDRDQALGHEERARARRALNDLNVLGSILTRTRKVDVPDAKALRVAKQIDVEWTDRERALYDGIQARFMEEYAARGVPPGFALQMPLRQAASCLPAMQEAMKLRSSHLSDEVEDFDYSEDEAPDLEVDESLPRTMPELLRPLPVDSKFEALRSRLVELRKGGMRQVMIFSFFKRTLWYLERRLQEDFDVRVMTGGTPMDSRQKIMEDFRKGEFEVLLLSQVGAEGLDFEFCSALVNYDLPWNPMQVEQRIGRLDRFGQTSEKIFIFNMRVPGTIETDIFDRLYRRIGVFQQSIGELEPILRDELKTMTRVLLDPRRTREERMAEADRKGLALARQAHEIARLEESRGALSTVDQLQIDGMTDQGPSDGRYVGPSEVERILRKLLDKYGGRLSGADPDGIRDLLGSEELARVIRNTRLRRSGSLHVPAQLAALLRGDGLMPLRITFDNEVASQHNVELISSRHPLIEVAVKVLQEDDLALRRFGVVGTPGLLGPGPFAVRLDLAESSGLRPQLELWATAVDIPSGAEVPELRGQLLEAAARGTLVDVDAQPHPLLPEALVVLEDLAARRRQVVQAERRADNEALVDARIASQTRSIDLKLEKAQATLEDVLSRGLDDRVARLHAGRIRNLKTDRELVAERLGDKKELHIGLSAVAIMQVHGV